MNPPNAADLVSFCCPIAIGEGKGLLVEAVKSMLPGLIVGFKIAAGLPAKTSKGFGFGCCAAATGKPKES